MIDYDEFLGNRFDIVVRYHYYKKFNFNYEQIIIWAKNEKWIKKVTSKKLFHDCSWMSQNINENWLKSNPYVIINNFYGANVKRFIFSLEKKLHLYWAGISVGDIGKLGKPFQSGRRKEFSISFIKELFTKDEFNKFKYTMEEMKKR